MMIHSVAISGSNSASDRYAAAPNSVHGMNQVLRRPMRRDPMPSTNGAHSGRNHVGMLGSTKIQNMSSGNPFSR